MNSDAEAEVKHNHHKSVKKETIRRRLNRRKLKKNRLKLDSAIKIRIVQLMKKIKSPLEMMLRLESEGFNVNHLLPQIRSFYLYYAERRIHKWIYEKTFNGIDEAKMYLRRQQIWCNKFLNHSQVFVNYHYRCSLVPKAGPQCAARKYFSYNKQTKEVILYKKDCPHTHLDIMPGLKLYLSTQTDWLLKQLCKSDRRALKQHDFRVLQAVRLRNCFAEPNDYDICYSPNWIFEMKFPNEKLALDYLSKDDVWEIETNKVYKTLSGRRNVHYRCNRLGLNEPNCDASKCLLYSVDSEEVSVYKKISEQTHEKIAEQLSKNLQKDDSAVRYSVTAKRKRLSINKGTSSNEIIIRNSNPNLGKDSHLIPAELVTGNDSVQYVINYLDDDQIICENDILESDSKWVCENTFATIMEASNYLEAANLGNVRTVTVYGEHRTYFRCNMVNKSEPQCNARAYLVRCADTDKILVYQNITQHTHDQITTTDIFQLEPKAAAKMALQTENVMDIETDTDSILFVKNNKWNLADKILNKDMVTSYINKENTWRNKFQNDVSSKVFYCCTNKQCKAEMCLIYEKLSNEVLVYRNDKHTHDVVYETYDLPLQFNATEFIPDSYPNSNIITKEELMIDVEPAPIANKECDTIYTHAYIEENETKPTISANNIEINAPLIGKLVSNEDDLNLNLGNSTESTYEIIISNNSDQDSLSGDEVENNLEEWKYETEFADYTLAEQYMNFLNLLSFKSNITKSGVKEYYNCKLVDNNGKNCPASQYLLFKDINSSISMYKRNVRHADNCTNAKPATMVADLFDSDENDADDPAEIILNRTGEDEYTVTCIEKTFESTQEAVEYLKNQEIWTFKGRIKLEEGCKEYYRCNLSKACEPECKATKLLFINYKTNVNSLYKNKENHSHNPRGPAAQAYTEFEKLDDATKNKMKELILAGDTPKHILEQLKQDFKVPYNDNLFYWIKRIRENRCRHFASVLHFNTIIENWLSQISAIPKNVHKPFCVNFSVEQPNKSFRCFLSTRRLLNNAVRSSLVRVDSTCILQWQHNTISIIGTIDLDQTFHLIGIAICSNTNERDYEFIFNAIQKGVHKCYKKIFKPECLISDENAGIQNAFIKVFGISGKIHMCSEVALSKMMCKLSACVKLDLLKKTIEDDIRKIQRLSSNTLFYKAVDLFFKKWRPLVSELNNFLNYFKTNWVIKNPNWFLGFRHFTPHTKKTIDPEYESLKDIYTTFEENLPIQALQSHIQIEMEKLEKISRCYAKGGSKQVVYKATISRAMYAKAANWINLQKEIILEQCDYETNYYFSADDKRTICKEKLQKYLACKHHTLEDFLYIQFSFWRVQKEKYSVTLTCNCSQFFENFVCEHSVGMAKMLKLIKFPSDIEKLILIRELNLLR